MIRFEGFPDGMCFTSVPDAFINQLAPRMAAADVILMLAVFNILFKKKGSPRYVTMPELVAHPAMAGRDVANILESVTEQGLILPHAVSGNAVIFLNNPEGRRAVDPARQGDLKLAPPSTAKPVACTIPNIFTLYEENIGLLTPMLAEELKDAMETYPEEWIRDAVKEAVSLNKRSWRYIQCILERWVAKGKNSHGTHRSDTERDKFIHGRYGGLVQR